MGAHVGLTRRRAAAGLTGVVLVGTLSLGGITTTTQAIPDSPSTSCAEITKTFPRGIAVSNKAAERAVRQGFERPQVRKALYRSNAKRLDKRQRGYLCPVRPDANADIDSTLAPEPGSGALSPSTNVAPCRLPDLRSTPNLTVGFPVPPERLPSLGSIPVSVLYVDFPDFPALPGMLDPVVHFTSFGSGVDAFFENMSYGKLSFNWSVHPTYIRMPSAIADYGISRRGGQFDAFMQEVISQSDPIVDFSGKQAVVVVLNPSVPESLADVSPAFPHSQVNAFRTDEGPVLNGTLVAGDAQRIGASVVNHEFGHLFGLTDLYNLSWRPGEAYTEQFKYSGWFDFMSYAPGRAREMLGWNRWLLGWVPDEEVRCLVDAGSVDLEINSLSSPTKGPKLAVIPLDSTRGLVVESRQRGFYCDICQDGVLVTLIDTGKGTGEGPIQVIRKPTSTEPLFADAILVPGDVVSFEGITIENAARSASGHAIRVSRGAS